MAGTTSNTKRMVGDGQNEALESFKKCKYASEEYDVTKGSFTFRRKCKYADMYGRCVFDDCLWDSANMPKLTHKWWFTCIICDKTVSLNPKHVDVPICDECRIRMLRAEKLPFVCECCGDGQMKPSKIMFSSLCDKCVQEQLFNNDYMVTSHEDRHHSYLVDPKGSHPDYDDV